MKSDKIKPHHLGRKAIIYVRQSTQRQVEKNTASRDRQYALVKRAKEFGFSAAQIVIVDSDQGQSGTSLENRMGFKDLLGAIAKQEVGIVLCIEASRLSRDNADFQHLVKIASHSATLIADEQGVYDPQFDSDRVTLSIKGTLSQSEHNTNTQRMIAAMNFRALEGKLRNRLSTGYVHGKKGEILKDPDEKVREMIELVFSVYERSSSVTGVLRHFNENNLQIPKRVYHKDEDSVIEYAPITRARVIRILNNPVYAGSYVYGRTANKKEINPENTHEIKESRKKVKSADWKVNRPGNHEGYISLAQFEENQRKLAASGFNYAKGKNSIREGQALLQGIILCGRCGKRMRASSSKIRERVYTYYDCASMRRQIAAPLCQSASGTILDKAITGAFFQHISSAEEIEATLASMGELEERVLHVQEQLQCRLKQAQKQAEAIKRRYDRIDPDHRLVAGVVEQELNEKYQEIKTIEEEIKNPIAQPFQPSREQLAAIRALATDLPSLWYKPTTTMQARKMILRALIKDVTVTHIKGKSKLQGTYGVVIRWQTEECRELTLPDKDTTNYVSVTPALIERVRELTPHHSDEEICEILAQENMRTARGNLFTPKSLKDFRWQHRISRRNNPLGREELCR